MTSTKTSGNNGNQQAFLLCKEKKNQIDGNNNKPTMIQSAFFQNISCDFQLPPFFVTSHFSDKQQNWSDSYFAFAVFIHYSVSVPDPQPLKAQQLSEFQRGLQLRIRGYKCDLAWSAEHDKSFLCLGLTRSEMSFISKHRTDSACSSAKCQVWPCSFCRWALTRLTEAVIPFLRTKVPSFLSAS